MKENEIDDPSLQTENTPGNRSRCNSKDLTLRLNKIEGQIRGINKMVNNEMGCDDVLIQVNAVQAALYSVGRIILENHVQHCLKDSSGEVNDKTLKDILVSINRLHQIGN